MAMGEVLQCFLNADLRSGHDGLADLAKKHDLDVGKLAPGKYVVFINSARDRIKVYAASNVIAYMKLRSGQKIDLRTVQEIPRVFKGTGKLDYDKALESAITKSLEKRGNGSGLQVYRAARAAGVM